LPDTAHHSRPRRLARSYLVRLFHSLPSSGFCRRFPECLGSPEGFVLKDGAVCERCNNNLGHLDQAVRDEFDIILFKTGVRGKRGRRPQLNSRGNMLGFWEQSGPVIHLNLGRTSVKMPSGHILGVAGNSKRSIKASVQSSGHYRDIFFQVRLGEGVKFVRGIVKIAFSSLAFFQGPSEVMADGYDSIRRFVVNGDGVRKIIWMHAIDDQFTNEVRPPLVHEGGDFYAISFRLGIVEFVVDLSSDMRLFEIFKQKANELYGTNGWSWLPL
jgi:hypothetical protein